MSDASDLVRVRDMIASGEARRLRLKGHLSLKDVADEIGCAKSAVFAYEQSLGLPRRGAHARRYLRLLEELAK